MYPRRLSERGFVKKWRWLALSTALLLILGACKGDVELNLGDLPTLMVLPTLTATPMRAALVPPTREFHNALPPTWTSTPVTPTLIPTATLVPVDTLPPPTATFTSTLVPTITLTPRFSPTYTNTVPPTVAPTATPMGDAFVIGESGVNLRNGPSMTFTPPLALLA
ncbi:MAG: hypothetical protein H7175_08175, partial [Burkholderiales bacterium]|nr:hypothetical protein [Anaerolineae bacterium]